MRISGALLTRLKASATCGAARFWGVLNVRLRWPRLTTRALMVLIAIIAVLFWAVEAVPWFIDRTAACQQRADGQAVLARGFKERETACLARARKFRAELDEWRSESGRPDALTEHYLTTGWEFALTSARFLSEMAAYHEAHRRSYLRARWLPWISEVPPPPPPHDPFSSEQPGTIAAPRAFFELTEGGVSVAFSPDGRTLAVGCRDRTVKLLELPSRKVLASFPLPEGPARHVSFTPDGKSLIGAGFGSLVRWWDSATGRIVRDFPSNRQPPSTISAWDLVTVAAFAPDGETIAVAAGKDQGNPPKWIQSIMLLDASTAAPRWEHVSTGSGTYLLAFSPDGTTLAYGDGGARLLDVRTGREKASLKPVAGHVVAVAFSPDGKTLAGAGSDAAYMAGFGGNGRVTLWDISAGTILRTWDGPTGRAQTVAFSPDGSTVAAGGPGPNRQDARDKHSGLRASRNASEVRLWDVVSGEPVWTVEGETGPAVSLAFSPDGKSLAFCDQDYVYLIDARSGRLRQIVMETLGHSRPQDGRRPGGRIP